MTCAWMKLLCLDEATVNGYCRMHFEKACKELKRMENGFVTKDSGVREQFSTGMQRDTQKGKARFDLVYKPLLWRWAELMARGAEKYGDNNWKLAATEVELIRFQASAERHMQQFLRGDTDEDHAAAVLFNVAGVLYVQERIYEELVKEISNT